MLKKLKEHWFGLVMSLFVVVMFAFVTVVAVAPHNDAKMRGFSPCTYDMAIFLGDTVGETKSVSAMMKTVFEGYVCYAGVIGQGVRLWWNGEQATPWANYFFEPETATWEDDTLPTEALPAENLFNSDDVKENVDEN